MVCRLQFAPALVQRYGHQRAAHPSQPGYCRASNLVVDVNGGVATVDVAAHDEDASIRVGIYGARSVSAGKRYVENLFTGLLISDVGASGTTIDFSDGLTTMLGTIQEGVTYHIKVVMLDIRTGLISAPQWLSTVAVDTTP